MGVMLPMILAALPVLEATIPGRPRADFVLGQFRMCFPNPNWRSEQGAPDLFTHESRCETHFFWEGGVLKGIKAVFGETDQGPYQGIDDWVNAALLDGADPDYLRLVPSDKGLLVWLTGHGLASGEEKYDTRCDFHLIAYSEAWPGDGDLTVYYIEDYKEGGVAHVFRGAAPGVHISSTEDKVLLRGYLDPYLEEAEASPGLRLHFEGVVVWEKEGIYR